MEHASAFYWCHSTLKGITDPYDGPYMWDGIMVGGNPALAQNTTNQGKLAISASTIRDAQMGIGMANTDRYNVQFPNATLNSGQYRLLTSGSRYRVRGDGGGGIVAAYSTRFENCAFAANHQRYPNPGSGLIANVPGVYAGNTFTCDAGGLADPCFYARPEDGGRKATNEFFADWDVARIRLEDNTFFCDPSFPLAYRSVGINTYDGGLAIGHSVGCSGPVTSSGCSGTVSYGAGNTFTNLKIGVNANHSMDGAATPLVIKHNVFENCMRGVQVGSSIGALTIAYNQVNTPSISSSLAGSPLRPQGITLAGCTGYGMYHNTLSKVTGSGTGVIDYARHGIVVNTGSNDYDNEVQLNVFDYHFTGATAHQLNGNNVNGLQFLCNDYGSRFVNSEARYSSDPVYGTVAATMKQNQGFCFDASTPAGNEFFNSCGTSTQRLYADGDVSQQVIYNANKAGTTYDPLPCVNSKYTVNDCNALINSTTCTPIIEVDFPVIGGDIGFKQAIADYDAQLDTLDEDSLAYGAVRWQRSIAIASLARWYNEMEYPDSAAALMASEERYLEALTLYLHAGDVSNATTMLGLMPDSTDDQAALVWLATTAIQLQSGSTSWSALDSAGQAALMRLTGTSTFSGFMASGIANFLELHSFAWPQPDTATGSSARYAYAAPGTNAQQYSNAVTLFPNPTTGKITVLSPAQASLAIYATDGRLVALYQLREGSNNLSLPQGITPGLYIGQCKPTTGEQHTIRIIYQP